MSTREAQHDCIPADRDQRLQAGTKPSARSQEVESDRDALRAQVETLSRGAVRCDKGEPGKRGPRPGGATHGRTPRPELARKREGHNPPPEALLCPCCGAPRLANGSHRSELIEVAVKAHVRVIDRTRWRKTCQCPARPGRCRPRRCRACFREPHTVSASASANRPLRRVAAWFAAQGLALSGNADGLGRMAVAAVGGDPCASPARRWYTPTRPARVRDFAVTG